MLIFLLSAIPAYGDCITVFFFFFFFIHHPSRLSSFRSIFSLIIILTFVLSFFGFIFLLSCSSFILFDFQVIFILIVLLKYPLLTLISLYIDFEPFFFFFHRHYITYLAFRATVIWN